MDDEIDGDRTAQSREIIEITPAGGNTGAVVTAADPNGAEEIVTHALGGPDAGSFTIDPGTGRLRTKAARDFEGRKTCRVEVTATGSSDAGATAEVTIKVTDEDQGPESMARRAWPGEHGPESMARRAWPGEHGPESMARRAWPGEQGPESMARRAWPGEHGPESKARRARPGEQGPESKARRAWPGEHGPESMARRAWPGEHRGRPGNIRVVRRALRREGHGRGGDLHGRRPRCCPGPADAGWRRRRRLLEQRGHAHLQRFARLRDAGRRQHGQHLHGGGEMTVKAYDGTCSDTRDVTVTVTSVDEEGMAPLSSQEPVVGAGPTASLTGSDGGITGETRQWDRFDAGRDLYRHRYSQVHDLCPGGYPRRGQIPGGSGHVRRRPRLRKTVVVSDNMVTAEDPLIVRCDASGNGEIDQSEVNNCDKRLSLWRGWHHQKGRLDKAHKPLPVLRRLIQGAPWRCPGREVPFASIVVNAEASFT